MISYGSVRLEVDVYVWMLVEVDCYVLNNVYILGY